MFFRTDILLSVLDMLANDSQAFFTKKSSNPKYDEVIEMTYVMDPNTFEQVPRLIFGEVRRPGNLDNDEHHMVSMIGPLVKIYTENRVVNGGQPHQDLLDFGLSNEEIKILKIIFRLVRKMASDK